MIETLTLFAQFSAQVLLVALTSVVIGILIQIAFVAALILGAVVLASMAVKVAVTDYLVPFFRAAINMVAAHPLIVSLVMVSILSIAFAVDKDFRSFIMRQNYPIIFAVSSVVTLAFNIFIFGGAITNIVIAFVSLTIVATSYKLLTILLDKNINQLIKANVISRFESLRIDNEVLSYAKQPHTLQFLVDKKCSLEQLVAIIPKVKAPTEPTPNRSGYMKQSLPPLETSKYSALETTLANPHIKTLIDTDRLTFTDIQKLWPLTFLENPRLHHLCQLGELSIHQCHQVRHNKDFLNNIQLDAFSTGLKGHSIDAISGLSPDEKRALALPQIKALFHSNQLSLSTLSSLSWEQVTILANDQWMQCFSPQEVFRLTTHQSTILSMENAYESLPIILGGYPQFLELDIPLQLRTLKILQSNIPETIFEYAFNLPNYRWDVLEKYHPILSNRNNMNTSTITSLTESQCRQLLLPKVKGLVENRVLSFQSAYTLPLTASIIDILESYSTELMNSDVISTETIMGLTESKQAQLLSPTVKRLVRDNTIPFELAINLSELEIEITLLNHQIIRMFPAHRDHVNFWDLRDLQQTPFGQGMLQRETTHRASVHITASQSATRLQERYPTVSIESNIHALIRAIRNTPHQHQDVALRGLHRLRRHLFKHTDPVSNVSITKLLALAYEAICDERTRIAPFEEGIKALINGLYDIQRGRNFDNPREIDDGQQDRYVCLPGTFNKIIEALCGVHPDAQQNYITMQLAAAKLPIIVKEEVQAFLNTISLSSDKISELLEAIRQKGVETIYPQIRPQIEQRVRDEFMILFINQPQELQSFIDNGKYADIEDIITTFHNERPNNAQHPYSPVRSS
ncbi:MAG: hypothetical protein VXW87_03995 [Pseudomonadota bacterium]|nr:hypothetical protein [Pseudomonadota bacterium]